MLLNGVNVFVSYIKLKLAIIRQIAGDVQTDSVFSEHC